MLQFLLVLFCHFLMIQDRNYEACIVDDHKHLESILHLLSQKQYVIDCTYLKLKKCKGGNFLGFSTSTLSLKYSHALYIE